MTRRYHHAPAVAPTKDEHDARVAERGRAFTDDPITRRILPDDAPATIEADPLSALIAYRKRKGRTT